MPSLEYFLVCRAVQLDINTNEISLVSVLEDISPDSFPHVIPKAIAVSLWNFQIDEATTDFQAILVVKVPGQPDVRFPMNFTHGIRRYRTIQGVLDIPIQAPGDIQFEVLLNGIHAATHTVRIHPVGVREATIGGKQLTRQ